MTSFTVGLDLGQGVDFSALAVVERVYVLPTSVSMGDYYRHPLEVGPLLREQLHVRALQRWDLGTPYTTVVADVARSLRAPALLDDAVLYLDATGVGRAVTDMFTSEYRRERFGRYWPLAVTITGGRERNGWNVPKADLLAAVQVALQQETLKVANDLALGPVLEREMTSFRQTIGQSGRESYDVQRRAGEGHGDLVMALALALFEPNKIGRPDIIEDASILRRETP